MARWSISMTFMLGILSLSLVPTLALRSEEEEKASVDKSLSVAESSADLKQAQSGHELIPLKLFVATLAYALRMGKGTALMNEDIPMVEKAIGQNMLGQAEGLGPGMFPGGAEGLGPGTFPGGAEGLGPGMFPGGAEGLGPGMFPGGAQGLGPGLVGGAQGLGPGLVGGARGLGPGLVASDALNGRPASNPEDAHTNDMQGNAATEEVATEVWSLEKLDIAFPDGVARKEFQGLSTVKSELAKLNKDKKVRKGRDILVLVLESAKLSGNPELASFVDTLKHFRKKKLMVNLAGNDLNAKHCQMLVAAAQYNPMIALLNLKGNACGIQSKGTVLKDERLKDRVMV